MLGLGVGFLFVPWNWILDTFFEEKFYVSKETFKEAKYQFNETYQTVDPIQRMLKLEKFIESQNRARLSSMKKASYRTIPTFLEIRDYANDDRPKTGDRVQESTGR